jgi:hypothetical protein
LIDREICPQGKVEVIMNKAELEEIQAAVGPEEPKSPCVSCDEFVPIFPLRFSVNPNDVDDNFLDQANKSEEWMPQKVVSLGGSGLGDMGDDRPLSVSFASDVRSCPTLGVGGYDIRFVGAGFVYLFDETQNKTYAWRVEDESNTFTELLKEERFMDGDISQKTNTSIHHGESPSCIWGLKNSRVHILLANTLLTKSKALAIQNDKDGIRSLLAVGIDLASWNDKHPTNHTFTAQDIGKYTEEFRRSDRPGFFDFSPRNVLVDKDNAQDRQKTIIAEMRGIYKAKKGEEEKLIAVVMHDPIALLEDMTGIIAEKMARLNKYLTSPARNRKKTAQGLLSHYFKTIAPNKKLRYEKRLDTTEYNHFPSRFFDEVKVLRSDILRWKKYRAAWLKTYHQTEKPYHWGAGFLRFDLSHPVSSTFHALSFTNCTDLLYGPTDQEQDDEFDLSEAWWAMEAARNPFMLNMEHDKGFGDDLLKLRPDTVTNIVKTTVSQIPIVVWRHEASRRILEQARVYMFKRVRNNTWKEKVAGKVEKQIQSRMKMKSVADAEKFIHYATREYKKQNAGHIENYAMPKREVVGKLEELINVDPGTLLKNIEKRGSLIDGTMDVLVWTDGKVDIKDLKYKPNPFLQKTEIGLAPIIGILSALNLYRAIDEFDWQKDPWISFSNLGSALAGVGTAVNSALLSVRAVFPAEFNRLTAYTSMKWLASVTATRLFGYGTAVLDGVTYSIKARQQYEIGNKEAGDAYVSSAATLLAGGGILTAATAIMVKGGTFVTIAFAVPVWGWVAAGVLLMGIGVVNVLAGEDAEFTEMDDWMDACAFGLQKRGNYKDNALEKEVQAFFEAYMGPRITKTSWGRPPALHLELTVIYPLTGLVERESVDPEGSVLVLSQLGLDQGKENLYTVLDIGKKANDFSARITFSYAPEGLGRTLSRTFVVKKSDQPFGMLSS